MPVTLIAKPVLLVALPTVMNVQTLKRRKNTDNAKKIVECKDDEWNNEGVCEKCHKACESCEGPSASLEGDGCLVCKTGYERNEADECNKCEGYLKEGICKPCSFACKTCNGPFALKDDTIGCLECNDGYYESADIKCVPCDKKCKTCSGKPFWCTSCEDSGELDEAT